MATPQPALLDRAQAAYERAATDPTGCGDVSGLVAEAREARSPEALVVALRAQAWWARQHLDAEGAKPLLDEAVRVAARHRLSQRLAEVLATRAAVNQELGEAAAAQRDLDRARGVVSTHGPADVEFQQAVLHQNTGQFAAASTLYHRLLHNPDAPLDMRVKAANNLALIECQLGDPHAAFDRLSSLAADAVQAGPVGAAIVTDSLGWVAVQLGRLSDGLRILESAAERHREAALPLGEHYLEHCDALTDLRLLPEALDMARLALEEFQAHGVSLLVAEAQVRVARLSHLLGDDAEAARAAAAARDLFRRQRRPAWAALSHVEEIEASVAERGVTATDVAALRQAAGVIERAGVVSWAVDAHLAAGRWAAKAGDRRTAAACFTDAMRLCRNGPTLLRLKGHLAGARLADTTGDDRLLFAHSRAGLAELAQHRTALSSTELRALASGHGVELGELSLRALLRHGTPGEVLQGMERTRAAALLPTQEDPSPARLPLLSEMRSVQVELAAGRAQTGREPPELLARLRSLEEGVRRAAWTAPGGEAAAPGGAPMPLQELRAALGGRVLVEYAVLDGEIVAVVLRRRLARVVRLGPADGVQEQADHLTFALRRLMRPAHPAPMQSALHARATVAVERLRELLVRPVGIGPDDPVVVVPSTRHWRLPWSHLLGAPAHVVPSAATWVRAARRQEPSEGTVVLVGGPQLRFAEAEVTALARIHEAPRILLPPHSTVPAVLAALRGARLAHLACHGHLRLDNPTFSSFQLTAGELSVHELDVSAVSPHRVVLSACDSGADVAYDGGELLGFVSTLLGRGTAGLLASGMQVSDETVVPLMRAVHEHLVRGRTVAESWHAATTSVDVTGPQTFALVCAFNAFGAA
ncbi:MAG: CHAT domain-containing protein [Dermatophilaceae bacterium]